MYTRLLNLVTKELASCVKRNLDGAVIPFDPANSDYQAFLKYKEEGGKVYGPDEEVPTGE